MGVVEPLPHPQTVGVGVAGPLPWPRGWSDHPQKAKKRKRKKFWGLVLGGGRTTLLGHKGGPATPKRPKKEKKKKMGCLGPPPWPKGVVRPPPRAKPLDGPFFFLFFFWPSGHPLWGGSATPALSLLSLFFLFFL
jgi:hypothetical protein